MSQPHFFPLDPACYQGDGEFVELTTDGVPAAQRLAFWRDGVLKRMAPVENGEASRPFRARLRRLVVDGAELVEHASDAICAERSPQRRRLDGCDDIGIDLMRDCKIAAMRHNGERRIRPGDLCVVDYAQPIEVRRSRHRAITVVLARSRVRAALGHDISTVAGHRIAPRGLATVLRHHMQATIDEAARMSAADRHIAVGAAAEMALSVLRAGRSGSITEVEQFESGFYRAALVMIERECGDPELSPQEIARTLGCSRSSLYRVFARHDESVAAVIWASRIERAWRMLTSAAGVGLLVSDIAQCCGFVEMPTFTRMFKRRYGMTPRDARELGSYPGDPCAAT